MMRETGLDALAERLGRLERENRRLKLAALGILVGVAAMALMGQAAPGGTPKVVAAEQFVLRDAYGKTWASLHLGTAGGSAALTLFDRSGKARASLQVEANGEPGLLLADASERPRVNLRTSGNGRPALLLSDQGGQPRVFLGVSPEGAPVAALMDRSGQTRADLQVAPDGEPALVLSDQNKKTRANLGLGKDGSPSLVLADETQQPRAVLGHTTLAAARTGTVEQRPASSLVLFDTDGRLIWKAP